VECVAPRAGVDPFLAVPHPQVTRVLTDDAVPGLAFVRNREWLNGAVTPSDDVQARYAEDDVAVVVERQQTTTLLGFVQHPRNRGGVMDAVAAVAHIGSLDGGEPKLPSIRPFPQPIR
jgi:hypothetical protein